MSEQLHRVPVWGGWFRLAHLAVGLSTLLLLATGWLIRNAPTVADAADTVHYYAASLLIFGLALRLVLGLFGSPVERLSALIPGPGDWPAMRDMLLFYATLGRAPLPRWYAHNPFWKPLYLLTYLLLALSVVSGALVPGDTLVLGWYMPSFHRGLASALAWLVLLHLVTVVLHDYRGKAADVSAIINGHRCFAVEKGSTQTLPTQASIRLDQIGR